MVGVVVIVVFIIGNVDFDDVNFVNGIVDIWIFIGVVVIFVFIIKFNFFTVAFSSLLFKLLSSSPWSTIWFFNSS